MKMANSGAIGAGCLGIDYGARLAGTTAVCLDDYDGLSFRQSKPKEDADAFLEKIISERKPSQVFLDAPLSLPSVYAGYGNDYFYRRCDRETGAMSPMFLGGLTARAISLKHRLESLGISVLETYPAQLVRVLGLNEWGTYKAKGGIPGFFSLLAGKKLPVPTTLPETWHQVDAFLAWLSVCRYRAGEALTYGDPAEGIIYV